MPLSTWDITNCCCGFDCNTCFPKRNITSTIAGGACAGTYTLVYESNPFPPPAKYWLYTSDFCRQRLICNVNGTWSFLVTTSALTTAGAGYNTGGGPFSCGIPLTSLACSPFQLVFGAAFINFAPCNAGTITTIFNWTSITLT